jgi:hypothetical protein
METKEKSIEARIEDLKASVKHHATEAQSLKKYKVNRIESKMAVYFKGIGFSEGYTFSYNEDSIHFGIEKGLMSSDRIYLKLDHFGIEKGLMSSDRIYLKLDHFGEKGYTDIEISFSSLSGIKEEDLKRCMVRGAVAEKILKHKKEMLKTLNLIYFSFAPKIEQHLSAKYKAERRICELEAERCESELDELKKQAMKEGIEFIPTKNRWDEDVWPELERNQQVRIVNIQKLKIVKYTPSGIYVDLVLTTTFNTWNSKTEEMELTTRDVEERVMDDKLDSFLRKYADQIKE